MFFNCHMKISLHSFNTFILDFSWLISSCNELNWHCWYVLEDVKDLMATRKFKNFRTKELLLQLTKNSKSIWAFRNRYSSFSNFLSFLTVFCPYIFRITSPKDFECEKRCRIKKRVWFSPFYITDKNKLHWLCSCSFTILRT